MNKRINKTIDKWWTVLRQDLQTQVTETPSLTAQQLLLHLWEKSPLILKESDYQKRQRAKNIVPLYERCTAKRANSEQCTRRRRDGDNFCGTHAKGTPHGTINMDDIETPLKDGEGNVYNPQDVFQNKVDPRKIHRYEKKSDGTYIISS